MIKFLKLSRLAMALCLLSTFSLLPLQNVLNYIQENKKPIAKNVFFGLALGNVLATKTARNFFQECTNSMVRSSVTDIEDQPSFPPVFGPLVGIAIDECSRKIGLALGGNPNVISSTGRPLIVDAIEANELGIARQLLRAGANPNTMYNYGTSILVKAIREGWIDFAKELLKAGANPNVGAPLVDAIYPYPGTEWSWRQLASVEKKFPPSLDLIKMLIAAGADVNIKVEFINRSILTVAAKRNMAEIVKILLEAGAEPDQDFIKELESKPELKAVYDNYKKALAGKVAEVMESITPGSTAPGKKQADVANIIEGYA